MNLKSSHPILLVEDSPEDFEITVRAFRKTNIANPIFRCIDGEDALDYLYQRGVYSSPTHAPRPAIILLDLNLPGTDGREVLAEIKQVDRLKDIPVVVLTTSADEVDIENCYRAGANSFVQKPVDLAGFISAIQRLKDYWFEIVLLPKTE
jgi:CheY-like chemotaxis protein